MVICKKINKLSGINQGHEDGQKPAPEALAPHPGPENAGRVSVGSGLDGRNPLRDNVFPVSDLAARRETHSSSVAIPNGRS